MIKSEIENDKILIQQFENNDIKIIIAKPDEMTNERFKTKCARLAKLLDSFGVRIRLNE